MTYSWKVLAVSLPAIILTLVLDQFFGDSPGMAGGIVGVVTTTAVYIAYNLGRGEKEKP